MLNFLRFPNYDKTEEIFLLKLHHQKRIAQSNSPALLTMNIFIYRKHFALKTLPRAFDESPRDTG